MSLALCLPTIRLLSSFIYFIFLVFGSFYSKNDYSFLFIIVKDVSAFKPHNIAIHTSIGIFMYGSSKP